MLFTLGLNIVYRSIPWYIVTILLVQLLLSLEFLVAFVFLLILLAFLLFSFFFCPIRNFVKIICRNFFLPKLFIWLLLSVLILQASHTVIPLVLPSLLCFLSSATQVFGLSLIHISERTRHYPLSRMPSSA